jgi:hypothetical protein
MGGAESAHAMKPSSSSVREKAWVRAGLPRPSALSGSVANGTREIKIRGRPGSMGVLGRPFVIAATVRGR